MKKGFTLVELIGVIIILGMIALLAFPPLLSMIQDANKEMDSANKTLLLSAADQYTNKYKNDFPILEGNTYCITYEQLIQEELAPSNLLDKGGNVIDYNTKVKVTINDNNKLEYSIDNSCEVIKQGPRPLIDELLKQYVSTNTVGLLKDDTGYYYKGTNTEVANNFVWWGGHLWRVISIDNDNNLTMITQQPITAIQPASSVWTTQAEYEASYINHWLNDLTDGVFLKSMEESDRNKIINSTFNVGIYTNISEITTTQKVGLLDETQYTKASGENSFLDIKNAFWLENRQDSVNVRLVSGDGSLTSADCTVSNMDGIRPVIKISSLTIIEGEGTLDNPYRESSTTTNTANIKVGEYVSIPTAGTDCGTDKKCLFRVASKDDNSIKVILNGLLPSTSQFGSSTTYTSGNTVDTVVTTFAETISNTYRYSGTDKTFGIGIYPAKAHYIAVQNTRYTGNAGLPVVGEIFSGNDINVTYPANASKTFVNIATIENSTVSSWFWLMNAFSSTQVRYIVHDGLLSRRDRSDTEGIRPVLFLNNNLTFTGGEGTAENPFVLE